VVNLQDVLPSEVIVSATLLHDVVTGASLPFPGEEPKETLLVPGSITSHVDARGMFGMLELHSSD
jgi:hypothetical protein